jgi:hypothetical protein|tara:strand:- start:671 stop:1102 length:432 start_codon:yes stop_codon:yes gene_type:complete
MHLISHRGNIDGKQAEKENSPDYIETAINKGFEVEVDVRFEKNKFFLGHDENQFEVEENFLLNKKIWCHAKTKNALLALHKINAHYFWHQEDDYTITSKGYIWTYPGKQLLLNSICVLPEIASYKNLKCAGICSDFIEKYKND